MAVTLSGQHLAALRDVAGTLLAPLGAEDGGAWCADVAASVRRAFAADVTCVACAVEPEHAWGWDGAAATAASAVSRYCVPTAGGARLVDPDADVDRAFTQLRAGAWSSTLLDTWMGQRFRHSRLYREGWVDGMGVRSGAGLARDGRGLVTDLLALGYRRAEPGGFGEANAEVCGLLWPAFLAGTAALRRLGALRAGVRAYADALPAGALVVDGRGRELHQNRALVALLAGDVDRQTVLAHMREVARRTRALAGRAPHGGGPDFDAPDARVRSRFEHYRVRASLLPAHEAGDGATVVTLERHEAWRPRPAPVLAPSVAAARASLTQREVDVARLLAERRTNLEVATTLGISPHTARHYTESVLAKLGVRSRRAVGHVLLRAGAEPDAPRGA